MQLMTKLIVWDLALFALALAAGLLLCFVGRKPAPGQPQPLRQVYGRRLMVASLLFLLAVPLDFWKAGVGILIAMAGMAGVLTWCMITMCQRLDDTAPKKP